MYEAHTFLRSLSLNHDQGNAVAALDGRSLVRWQEGHNLSIAV
jgi:hypothetical protein